MGSFSDRYDWNISDFMIEEGEEPIIKIKAGPIVRNDYYFYIFKNKDNYYYVKMFYITDEEHFKDLINVCNEKNEDKKTSIFDAYKKYVGCKEYNELCKKNNIIYKMNLDNNYLSIVVDTIMNLDYSNDYGRAHGLDGYSLFTFVKGISKVFESWVYCNNDYYFPILELVNYLLDCVSVYESTLFYLPENYKLMDKKIIDNKILLDRSRLEEIFKRKVKYSSKYSKKEKEYLLSILSTLSDKKLLKVNYNFRLGMFNYKDLVKIIKYIIKQDENNNFDCYGWVEYEI